MLIITALQHISPEVIVKDVYLYNEPTVTLFNAHTWNIYSWLWMILRSGIYLIQWMRHDDKLWKGSGNVRSMYLEDKGTNFEDGDSNTDW